ncbi:MAG: sigma-70 family RNA polymerase sigma factor, partial [Bacteroidota bacterium]
MKQKITYQNLVELRNGDAQSFKMIYDNYHSTIYYYAYKFIQNESMAEEATADVFITLWKKRASVNPSLPVQALLYKIAKDTAYNYLKKIAANDRLKQEYLNNYPAIDLQNGEVLLLEKEQLFQVERVIESLPPKRLEVFKLRYYEGLDNSGIAQQLGISINTVKVH